jgi:hypothetical protein
MQSLFKIWNLSVVFYANYDSSHLCILHFMDPWAVGFVL